MDNNEDEIDFKSVFMSLNKHKWIIVTFTLVAAILGVVYTMMFVTPVYTATTTILLTNAADSSKENTITTSDIGLNSSLVSTYRELIKGKDVIEEVLQNVSVSGLTVDQISKNLKVESITGTQILKISYTDANPEVAKNITNATADVFIDKVKNKYYKIDNLKVVNEAELPTSPSNINHKKDVAIFTLSGFVISIIFVFIINMFDTTVQTKEDIENQFGIHVLATIPTYETQMKKVDKKRKKNMGGK